MANYSLAGANDGKLMGSCMRFCQVCYGKKIKLEGCFAKIANHKRSEGYETNYTKRRVYYGGQQEEVHSCSELILSSPKIHQKNAVCKP